MMRKVFTGSVIIMMILVITGCTNPFRKSDIGQKSAVVEEDKNAITEQFVQTQAQEGFLQEDELHRLIAASEDAALFDDERGPELLKDRTYAEKLTMIGSLVKKMMMDTGRTRISRHDSVLTQTDIPLIDLITGVKKYYYGTDGEKKYQEYLAQRFTIGVYPTMDELNGQWVGEMMITDVMIFHELGGAPVGYDEGKIKAMKGQKNPIAFILASTGSEAGTMTPSSGQGGMSMPFTYSFLPNFSDKITSASFTYRDITDKGKMSVIFAQGRIKGNMQLFATKDDGTLLKGTMITELFNGYIKISGEISAKKQ